MKKFTVILSVLLLAACGKEELPAQKPASNQGVEKSYRTPEIDYQRAQTIAAKAPSMFGSAETKGEGKSILNSEVVSNGEATKSTGALMYIFNYAEGGYAVVPAVDTKGEIVAYVEKGSLTMSDTLTNDLTRFLVKLMMNRQKQVLAEYEGSQVVTKKSVPPIVENHEFGPMCSMIGQSSDYGRPVPAPELAAKLGDEYYTEYGCWRPNSYLTYSTTVLRSPMIINVWGQGYPYNQHAPMINGENALSGSVAVACAHIMLYHGYPAYFPVLTYAKVSSYSQTETKIDLLKTYETVIGRGPGPRDYSSRLVTVLGYLVNSSWGLNRTSAYTSAVPEAFYKMGYPKPVISSYSEAAVKQSIDASSPVYISEITSTSGGCLHAWVIDGYKTVRWTIRRHVDKFDEFGNYNGRQQLNNMVGDNTYYHSNFGFNGDSNGYYEEGVFDTSKPYESTGPNVNNGNFTPGTLHIIAGIRK